MSKTAYRYLDQCKKYLTKQQYKTLKGQIKAGDGVGAIVGMKTIIERYKHEQKA